MKIHWTKICASSFQRSRLPAIGIASDSDNNCLFSDALPGRITLNTVESSKAFGGFATVNGNHPHSLT